MTKKKVNSKSQVHKKPSDGGFSNPSALGGRAHVQPARPTPSSKPVEATVPDRSLDILLEVCKTLQQSKASLDSGIARLEQLSELVRMRVDRQGAKDVPAYVV